MNPERLKKLQAQVAQVRIGGKGTPRRKKKIVHQTTATDDKKLQSTLKKLAVNPISGIEEVNIFKNDGTVNIFNNPRTQASLASNTFAVTGHSETRNLKDFISGPEGMSHLQRMAFINSLTNDPRLSDAYKNADNDIPDVVKSFEDESEFDHIKAKDKATAQGFKIPTEIVD